MTTISIVIPEFNTSKEEEIKLLGKLVSHLNGTQSYLESLLSPAVLNWFSDKVHSDNDCDLMGNLVYEQKQAEEARKQYEDARNSYKKDVMVLNDRINQLQDSLSKAESALETSYTNNRQLISESLRLQDVIESMKSDARQSEESMKVLEGNHAEDCRAYEHQIMALKARLFDLQNPNWGSSVYSQETVVFSPKH